MRDLVCRCGYLRPMSAQPHMIPSWRNTSAEVAVHVPWSSQVELGDRKQPKMRTLFPMTSGSAVSHAVSQLSLGAGDFTQLHCTWKL